MKTCPKQKINNPKKKEVWGNYWINKDKINKIKINIWNKPLNN